MSGVEDVLFFGCLVRWMSYFTHSVVVVWCGGCLVWWLSGVGDVWCGGCLSVDDVRMMYVCLVVYTCTLFVCAAVCACVRLDFRCARAATLRPDAQLRGAISASKTGDTFPTD